MSTSPVKPVSVLRIERVLKDGRILFCRDGVYFSLTREQVSELVELVNNLEKKDKNDE